MTLFRAVMIDETGCEFSAEVEAYSWEEAYDKLNDNYPESRVDELRTEAGWRAKEDEYYRRKQRALARALRAYDEDFYDEDDY